MNMNNRIGILCAMLEEVSDILKIVKDYTTQTIGCRTYYEGRIAGKDVVVVFSRWGKVGAAATTTMLIDHFKVNEIVFVGTAGAMAPNLRVGDVVIGKRFVQHDFDCSPILPKYEIPFLKTQFIVAQEKEVREATAAVAKFLEPSYFQTCFTESQITEFQLNNPHFYVGDIASGDSFFSTNEQKENLLKAIPSILCVEMEGAAVAQVCCEYETPLTVIRVISDSGDDNASVDFGKFIVDVAAKYSQKIVEELLAIKTND